jgi:hypothetical protein
MLGFLRDESTTDAWLNRLYEQGSAVCPEGRWRAISDLCACANDLSCKKGSFAGSCALSGIGGAHSGTPVLNPDNFLQVGLARYLYL